MFDCLIIVSRDQGKISYGVQRSFGATGLPEFSTSTKRKKRGSAMKDSLDTSDNVTLERGGEIPIHPPPPGIYPGGSVVWIEDERSRETGRSNERLDPPDGIR
jgi:hypothetical protein